MSEESLYDYGTHLNRKHMNNQGSRRRRRQKVKKIIAENLPSPGENLDIQVQEAKSLSSYLSAKRSSLRHNETTKNQI